MVAIVYHRKDGWVLAGELNEQTDEPGEGLKRASRER
jgi:hypothetical protein